MKKFFATLICICLAFSFLTINSHTANAATDGCYTYSIYNGEAIIEKYNAYNGVRGELIIPSSLGGYPVTEIKANAFFNNVSLNFSILLLST